jgi:hypothetical protein
LFYSYDNLPTCRLVERLESKEIYIRELCAFSTDFDFLISRLSVKYASPFTVSCQCYALGLLSETVPTTQARKEMECFQFKLRNIPLDCEKNTWKGGLLQGDRILGNGYRETMTQQFQSASQSVNI